MFPTILTSFDYSDSDYIQDHIYIERERERTTAPTFVLLRRKPFVFLIIVKTNTWTHWARNPGPGPKKGLKMVDTGEQNLSWAWTSSLSLFWPSQLPPGVKIQFLII